MKVVIADDVNIVAEPAGDADAYYGEDLDMNGDLDLSFLDDGKDEPKDNSYDD